MKITLRYNQIIGDNSPKPTPILHLFIKVAAFLFYFTKIEIFANNVSMLNSMTNN